MTPQRQLIAHGGGRIGDCHRTCVASILDLHPFEVPHFVEQFWNDPREPDASIGALREWLAERGYGYAMFCYPPEFDLEAVLLWTRTHSPGVPMILSGQSQPGTNHAVVIMDGAIVSDPMGCGLIGPATTGQFWVELITVGGARKELRRESMAR